MTPIATIILSYFFLGTKIFSRDIGFCVLCGAAVVIIITGYAKKENNID